MSRVDTLAMMLVHATRAHRVRGEFHGRVVTFRESAGVRLSEVWTTRPVRLPTHTHESAFFWLVLSGMYREQYGAEDHWHRPFSMGYCPPMFEHSNEIGRAGARFFGVEINGEFCRVRKTGGGMDALLTDSLIAALIANAFEPRALPERGRPPWLGPVVSYIDAHYTKALRIGTLAADAGVHPVHLSRVFHRVHGCSIPQYQTLLRIRRACLLFDAKYLTLSQIASMTGFADQSHFTRAFTSTAGYPPGAFRRSVFPHVPYARARLLDGRLVQIA